MHLMGTSEEWPRYLSILVLSGALGLLALPPVESQPMDLDTPADSPLWWTLTDELSPAQLRAVLRDREAHRQRHAESVAADRTAPLAQPDLEELISFEDPGLTPELMPMWEAFTIFSSSYVEGAAPDLERYAISPAGRELICEMAKASRSAMEQLIEQVQSGVQKFLALQRHIAHSGPGPRGLQQAIENQDVEFLARWSSEGSSPEEVRAWMEDWQTRPTVLTSEVAIVELRGQLSSEDWNRFREYLLRHMAPQVGPYRDFELSHGDAP